MLLSRFSRVWLCVTPETAAHQASPSLGLSRQEHWSGLPFPSPMHESEKWQWSHSVVSDSSDPVDCSPPGSSIHVIFQAKVLEWGAIAIIKKKKNYLHTHKIMGQYYLDSTLHIFLRLYFDLILLGVFLNVYKKWYRRSELLSSFSESMSSMTFIYYLNQFSQQSYKLGTITFLFDRWENLSSKVTCLRLPG